MRGPTNGRTYIVVCASFVVLPSGGRIKFYFNLVSGIVAQTCLSLSSKDEKVSFELIYSPPCCLVLSGFGPLILKPPCFCLRPRHRPPSTSGSSCEQGYLSVIKYFVLFINLPSMAAAPRLPPHFPSSIFDKEPSS